MALALDLPLPLALANLLHTNRAINFSRKNDRNAFIDQMCSVLIDYEAKTCLDHSACVAGSLPFGNNRLPEENKHKRMTRCCCPRGVYVICCCLCLCCYCVCRTQIYLAGNLFINIFPVKCHKEAGKCDATVGFFFIRDGALQKVAD